MNSLAIIHLSQLNTSSKKVINSTSETVRVIVPLIYRNLNLKRKEEGMTIYIVAKHNNYILLHLNQILITIVIILKLILNGLLIIYF